VLSQEAYLTEAFDLVSWKTKRALNLKTEQNPLWFKFCKMMAVGAWCDAASLLVPPDHLKTIVYTGDNTASVYLRYREAEDIRETGRRFELSTAALSIAAAALDAWTHVQRRVASAHEEELVIS
jgi:hypothetical protein